MVGVKEATGGQFKHWDSLSVDHDAKCLALQIGLLNSKDTVKMKTEIIGLRLFSSKLMCQFTLYQINKSINRQLGEIH